MARNRWLTPDIPATGFICRRLLIPNGVDWVALVSGCLSELRKASNFEEYGTATPEETATLFGIMFDEYSLEGQCRMIGEIIPYAGATSPDPKLLLCDGTWLDTTDYADLFAVIGFTYGMGDSTHFLVPDLRARVPLMAGTPAAPLSVPWALGLQFGLEFVQLTAAEMPSHTHTDSGHTHTEGVAVPALGAAIVGVPVPSAVPSVGVTGSGTANLSTTGGDTGHINWQPSLAINYLIVARP